MNEYKNLLDLPGEPLSGGFLDHVKILIPGILVMVALYTVFVSIFFFTYGAYVEKSVVQNNAKLLVEGLVGDISFFGKEISPSDMKTLEKLLQKIQLPDTTGMDTKVAQQNKEITKQTAIVVGVGAIIAIVIAIIFWWLIVKKTWKDFGINIMVKSLLLLFIVGCTEFFYFTFISKNYRSLDPNVAKKAIIQSIQDELKTR
jgi:hypothetical protein